MIAAFGRMAAAAALLCAQLAIASAAEIKAFSTAKALVKYLTSPEAQAVFKAKGFGL